ncbi:TetR/AcrR family transcriptional regulator [Agromyces bauzanensis]
MHSQAADDRLLRIAWGLESAPTRGPRARFTVQDVASTASTLADARGLAAVSLARVAAELGLTTTALYRYVDSKDSLVELMTDVAVGPAPELDAAEWLTGVRTWMRELHARYSGHPWLTEVQVSGLPRYPNRLAWIESLLVVLDRGGLADPMHVALLLESLARAFSAIAPGDAAAASAPAPWLAGAVAERFPRLARELDRDWGDVEPELLRAVDTVLRGAERNGAGSDAAGEERSATAE